MIRNIAWTLLSIASVAKKAAIPISIGLAAMRGERAEISKMSKATAKNAPEISSGLTDRTDIAIPPESAIANVPSSATRQSFTSQGAEQKGECRYGGEDNEQAEQPRDLDGAGPTSRKRSDVARQWHRRSD